MLKKFVFLVIIMVSCLSLFAADNIVTKNVPLIEQDVLDSIARYKNVRSASVIGWVDDQLLVRTRFGDTSQIHRVHRPLGMREQLSFAEEPIGGVALPRKREFSTITYLKDEGGTESYQLFGFNLKTKRETRISDGTGRYTGLAYSPSGNFLSYTSTKRTGQYSDLHIMDVSEYQEELVLQIDEVGWSIIAWHPNEDRLLIRKYISVVEAELYELDLATKEKTRLLADHGDLAIGTADYLNDGSILVVSDLNSNFRKIFQFSVENQELRVLISASWDVNSFALSPNREQLIYSVNADGYTHLYWYDIASKKSTRFLAEFSEGQPSGIRFNFDQTKVAFNYSSAQQQTDVYTIDLNTQEVTRWTQSEYGELDPTTLVSSSLFRYESFDGLEIPAFIYKPTTEAPHPVLVYIHGGPASQHRPGFSTRFQYYVNELGLAVIAPNVRGSRGYGNEYVSLDDWELREDSVSDIGALLDWIGTQSDLDTDAVIVDGGSYGGYMVLACMVHYGDRLLGGSERVGISNFVTFLENTQGYRRDLRRVEYGDERIPEIREFLESIAPLNHVHRINKPLLVVQGLNDPRVPASESRQIVDALEENDIPVWYVLYKDEGHGLRKKPNQDHSFAVQVQFLQYLLDGVNTSTSTE